MKLATLIHDTKPKIRIENHSVIILELICNRYTGARKVLSKKYVTGTN